MTLKDIIPTIDKNTLVKLYTDNALHPICSLNGNRLFDFLWLFERWTLSRIVTNLCAGYDEEEEIEYISISIEEDI